MTQYAPANRLEGRLFAEDGHLCMVVCVDQSTGMAQISSQRRLFDMPLSDVSSKLASYTHLSLDGLNSQRSEKRLVQNDDGWFFKVRGEACGEALKGPFESKEAANDAMGEFVIASQEGRVPGTR